MKLKSLILFIVGCSLYPTFLFAQLNSYQFEQIDSLQKIERRIVAVFIHTDWCKYCQALKSTTFKDKQIIKQLNKYFYFVDFNAEEKRDIVFNEQTFRYKPTGINIGMQQLAEQLATVNNKVSYPTLCFLNASFEIVFQIADYVDIRSMKKLLESMLRSAD